MDWHVLFSNGFLLRRRAMLCGKCGSELGVATIIIIPPIIISSLVGGKIIKRRQLFVNEAEECYCHRFVWQDSRKPVPGLNARKKELNIREFREHIGQASYHAIGAVAKEFGIFRIMDAPKVRAMPEILRRLIEQVCVHHPARYVYVYGAR